MNKEIFGTKPCDSPAVSVGKVAGVLFVVLEHLNDAFTDVVHTDREAEELRLSPNIRLAADLLVVVFRVER